MALNSNKLNTKKENSFYHTLLELTRKAVGRYVARKVIPVREKEDVETAVIEKFLAKQDKIEESFQAKSKKQTYYIAIINRMCAEVIRKEHNHWYAVNNLKSGSFAYDTTMNFETEKHTLIKEELKRFDFCLVLFNGEKSKTLLFLKIFFNIPINDSDVINYAGKNNEEVFKLLKERNNLSKTEIYERLAKIVFLVEHKEISGDAVRMWMNKQVDILLRRLNGRHSRFHNRETIGIMLEMQESKESSYTE